MASEAQRGISPAGTKRHDPLFTALRLASSTSACQPESSRTDRCSSDASGCRATARDCRAPHVTAVRRKAHETPPGLSTRATAVSTPRWSSMCSNAPTHSTTSATAFLDAAEVLGGFNVQADTPATRMPGAYRLGGRDHPRRQIRSDERFRTRSPSGKRCSPLPQPISTRQERRDASEQSANEAQPVSQQPAGIPMAFV